MLGWWIREVFGLGIELVRVGDWWVLVDLILCVVWVGAAHFIVRFSVEGK